MTVLAIKDLKVSVDHPSINSGRVRKQILKGVDLEVDAGQIHVVMGPNGSGKSTLAQVIAGHPMYTIVDGRLTMDNRNIAKLTADKRANLGIFLGFQHPVEIPGVSVFNVLRKAKQALDSSALSLGHSLGRDQKSVGNLHGTYNSQNSVIAPSRATSPRTRKPTIPQTYHPTNLSKLRENLLEYASSLKLSDDFLRRSLNEGFSGGEKKRSEILQMLALKPKLVILDEIDSGLDVDGLKLVAYALKKFRIDNPRSAIVVITHYARILKYLKPDFVHVMVEGKIVKSGSSKLATDVEKSGYQSFTNKNQKLNIKDQNGNLKFKKGVPENTPGV